MAAPVLASAISSGGLVPPLCGRPNCTDLGIGGSRPLHAIFNKGKTHTTWRKKQQVSKKGSNHVVQALTAGSDDDASLLVSQRRNQQAYLPTIWDPELIISSATTHYKYDEDHATRIEDLKQATKALLKSTKSTRGLQLKLIDNIQRLGLAYHFDEEINDALTFIHSSMVSLDDLFTASLHFRLLRQNGFPTSPEVCNKFLDKTGEFMDELRADAKGILSLYEASSLGLHGEIILEKAKKFSTIHLKSLSLEKLENVVSEQIQLSLEFPLHQRLPWVEARKFINIYERDESRNLVLLELSKLNYNMVQSTYMEELKELAKWWQKLNFKEKYPFARDRLVECYFYAMGCVPHPKLYKCRKSIAKGASIAAVLDDIYDIYGTLDELEKLTDAIARLDLDAMEDLPEYMRPCYLAIYEEVKETVKDLSQNFGMDILPYIKQNWVVYTSAYMKEARWFYSGYMPSFDEYLDNGMRSIGSIISSTYGFFGTLNQNAMTENLLQWVQRPDSEFLYLSAIIGRLHDDLQTSKAEMERGEVVKSVRCYMEQEGVSEEEAKDHIRCLISKTWAKLNGLVATKSLPMSLSEVALNTARCWQQMYKKNDWFSVQSQKHKDSIMSYFMKPFPITKGI